MPPRPMIHSKGKDEFPWDAADVAAKRKHEYEQGLLQLEGLIMEERLERAEERKGEHHKIFWAEAQRDVAAQRGKALQQELDDERASRMIENEALQTALIKVKAERDSLFAQLQIQNIPMKVSPPSRTVAICLDSAVINVEAEFALRWWGHGHEPFNESLSCRLLAEQSRRSGDVHTARLVEHVLSEPGFLSACHPHGGALDALQGMRSSGLDLRLCASGHVMRFEASVAEYMAWVREHLGADWLGRMVVCRDFSLVKAKVLVAGRSPNKGASVLPEWDLVIIRNIAKGKEAARGDADWRRIGAGALMEDWDQWEHVILGRFGGHVSSGSRDTPDTSPMRAVKDSGVRLSTFQARMT